MVKTSKKSSKNNKLKTKDTKLDKNENTKKNVKDKNTVKNVKLSNKNKTINKNDKKETQNDYKLEQTTVDNNKNYQGDKNETKPERKFKILDLLFNTNYSNTYLEVSSSDNLSVNDSDSKTNIAKTNKKVPVVKDTTVKLIENKELNEILNRFLKNLCQITDKILVNSLNYNEGFAILLKDVNLIKSAINPKSHLKTSLNKDTSNNIEDTKLGNEVINILYEKLLLIVIYTCKYFFSGKSGNNERIEDMANLLYKLITRIFDELIAQCTNDYAEYNQNKLLLVIVNNSCLDELIINSKLYKKHIFNVLSLIINATKPNAKENKDRDVDLLLYKLLQSFQVKDVLNVLLSNLNNNTNTDIKTLIINILNITDNNILNNVISRLNDNDPRVKAEVYKKLHPLFNQLNTDYVVHIFNNFLSHNLNVPNSSRSSNKTGENSLSDFDGNNNDLEEEFYNMITNWIVNIRNTDNLDLLNRNDSDSNSSNKEDNSSSNTSNKDNSSTTSSNKDKDKETDSNSSRSKDKDTDSVTSNNTSNKDNKEKEEMKETEEEDKEESVDYSNYSNTNKLVEFINHLFKNTLQLTSVLNILVKYFKYITSKYSGNNLNEDELVIYNEFTNSTNNNNVLLYIYNTLQVDPDNKLEVNMGKLVKELKPLVNSEELKEGPNVYLVVNNINLLLVLIHNQLTNPVTYGSSFDKNNNKNKDINKDNSSTTSSNKDDCDGNEESNSNYLEELETNLVKLIKSAPLKSIVVKLINEYIGLTNLNSNHSLNNGYLLTNNLVYYVFLVLFSVNSSNNQGDNYKNGLMLEGILNDVFDPHNVSTIKKIRIDFNNVKLIRNIKEISKFDFSNYSINQLVQFTNQIDTKLALYNNNNNILKNILKNSKDNNNLVNKELNDNITLVNKYKSLLDKINTELNGRYAAILLLVYVYFNLPNTGPDLNMMGMTDSSGNMYNISGTTSVGNLELVNRVYSKYILSVLKMYTGTSFDNDKDNKEDNTNNDKDKSQNNVKIGGLEYYNNVLLLKILCVYNFVMFNSNYSDMPTVVSNIRNELNVYYVLFTNIIESIGCTRSTSANKQLNGFGSKGNDLCVYKLEMVLKIMVDLLYLLAGPIPGGSNGLASPTQSSPSNPILYTPSQSPTISPKANDLFEGSSKLVENILKGILQMFNGDTVVNNYVYSILIKLLPKILYVTINSGTSELLSDFSTVIVELLIFYPPNSANGGNSTDTSDVTKDSSNSSFNSFSGNSNEVTSDRLYINNYDLGILQSTLSYLYNNNVDIGNTLNRIITTTFHYYFSNLTGVCYVLSNVKYFLINLINISSKNSSNYNGVSIDVSNSSRDGDHNENQDKKSVVNIIANILVTLLKSNKYTNINEMLLVINFIINKNFISFDSNSSNKDTDSISSNNTSNKDNKNRDNSRNDNLNDVYILLKHYYVKHDKHYKNNKLLLFILNQLNPNSDTKLTQNEQLILSNILSNKNKYYSNRDKNEVVTKKPYCKYLLTNNTKIAKVTNRVKRKRVVDLETSSSSGFSSYDYGDDEEDVIATDSEYYTDTTY